MKSKANKYNFAGSTRTGAVMIYDFQKECIKSSA